MDNNTIPSELDNNLSNENKEDSNIITTSSNIEKIQENEVFVSKTISDNNFSKNASNFIVTQNIDNVSNDNINNDTNIKNKVYMNNKDTNIKEKYLRINIILTFIITLQTIVIVGLLFAIVSIKQNMLLTTKNPTVLKENLNSVINDFTPNGSLKDDVVGNYDALINDTALKNNSTNIIPNVVENVYPSVVSINTIYNIDITNTRPRIGTQDDNYSTSAVAYASGVILEINDDELIVLTNGHVVASDTSTIGYYTLKEEYDKVNVIFFNDVEVNAYIKGINRENDLAVIAVPLQNIDKKTLSSIKCVEIGNSNKVVLGQNVIAIGNALGNGLSVTSGIISAKDVTVTIDDICYNAYQTDAAINHGNSGGGLFNLDGELIGINSSRASSDGAQGMGYAIPITEVWPLVEELVAMEGDEDDIASALSTKGSLGIYCTDIDEEIREKVDVPMGVYVISVMENYPAYRAGLQEDDIIIKINDVIATDTNTLIDYVGTLEKGDKVTLKIKRYDEETDTWNDLTIKTSLGRSMK